MSGRTRPSSSAIRAGRRDLLRSVGKYAVGDSHTEAVSLLRQADPTLDGYLLTLLNIKSKVAYTHQAATSDERKKARRAADALGEAARRA